MRLAKRPRTVHNNRTTTMTTTTTTTSTQHVDAFGKESMAHISREKMQELLRDPETSVARLVALKLAAPQNRNIRVPNVREKWVEVLTDVDGEVRWTARHKGGVLIEDVVETNANMRDGEADESTAHGARYSRWYQRLLTSQDENGTMFREQCDRVYRVLAEATRGGGATQRAAAVSPSASGS